MPEAITASREIEISEPSGIVKPRKITASRLDRAAKELNLLKVSAAGLLNIATIGKFLDQIGILQYGNGRLLGSAEMISEAAARCAKLANSQILDDETRQGYLDLQLRFVAALDRNIELQIEVNNAASTKAATPTALPSKPFLPGAQISPINIQINANAVEKKVEEPCKP